jgi:hypothetical protein
MDIALASYIDSYACLVAVYQEIASEFSLTYCVCVNARGTSCGLGHAGNCSVFGVLRSQQELLAICSHYWLYSAYASSTVGKIDQIIGYELTITRLPFRAVTSCMVGSFVISREFGYASRHIQIG